MESTSQHKNTNNRQVSPHPVPRPALPRAYPSEMTPKEITTIFATPAAAFQPIVGQPSDNDLTALRDILYPLLLDIPYTEYAIIFRTSQLASDF